MSPSPCSSSRERATRSRTSISCGPSSTASARGGRCTWSTAPITPSTSSRARAARTRTSWTISPPPSPVGARTAHEREVVAHGDRLLRVLISEQLRVLTFLGVVGLVLARVAWILFRLAEQRVRRARAGGTDPAPRLERSEDLRPDPEWRLRWWDGAVLAASLAGALCVVY